MPQQQDRFITKGESGSYLEIRSVIEKKLLLQIPLASGFLVAFFAYQIGNKLSCWQLLPMKSLIVKDYLTLLPLLPILPIKSATGFLVGCYYP